MKQATTEERYAIKDRQTMQWDTRETGPTEEESLKQLSILLVVASNLFLITRRTGIY